MKNRRNLDMIVGVIQGDATIIWASDDFSVIKQGGGIFDVVFPKNFRFVTAKCQSHSTGYDCTVIRNFGSINGFRCGCNSSSSGGGGDIPWSFVAFGEVT